MSDFTDWRDVKAKAREIDPHWHDADRVEQRALMRGDAQVGPEPRA
ncbi:hypothetical protein [Paractinoplanes toevensis]|nr:hypothetical protein [Actinoplanes toevensis]